MVNRLRKSDKPNVGDVLGAVGGAASSEPNPSEQKHDDKVVTQNSPRSKEYEAEREKQENRKASIGNDQRQTWSRWIIGFISWMIVSQTFFIAAVGYEWMTFANESYKWLLPIYFAQNFAQMVGLAIIVIRSLFQVPNLPRA